MKVLIEGAKIIDKNSPYHGKIVNVLVSNGQIEAIGKDTPKADKVIEGKGKYLTIGWFDMSTTVGDPGFEFKEDFESVADAALAGGFTGLAILPNNSPVTQTKNDVKYIKTGSNNGVDFFPVAAVTLDNKGEDLTEMIDLHTAGAVAFSDGRKPIWHTDILLKSLQYLQKFDGLLINRAEDIHLNMFGVMNEGTSSTSLGMKGMPKLAEEIAVQRDLEVLAYAGGRLHINKVSSKRTLALIKAAKKKGLQVTCDVAAYQTSFTDEDLHDFETNLKVNPPFREAADNKAIIKALEEGVIDAIVSGHIPQDEESKKLEFDLADFGIIGLQTTAAEISKLSDKVPLEVLLDKITSTPRELLNLDMPKIDKGIKANLTLFDPKAKWTLDNKTNKSKS
ncbi:dihydroorotase, partial [Fulvivirga sp. RKSG066]|uniref:dihydroorotase n=1 Tax=Fulvivirga aurantia TaxID=2529383 RepID=UPI0012BBE421